MGWALVGALVAVLRPWPLPQGQRKELPGPAGKGSRPHMEENELYSSTTAGEGLPLLGRLCREGLGPQPRLTLPALWLPPALASPLISLSASLPGGRAGGAWPAPSVRPSAVVQALSPGPRCGERARLEVGGSGSAEEHPVNPLAFSV